MEFLKIIAAVLLMAALFAIHHDDQLGSRFLSTSAPTQHTLSVNP